MSSKGAIMQGLNYTAERVMSHFNRPDAEPLQLTPLARDAAKLHARIAELEAERLAAWNAAKRLVHHEAITLIGRAGDDIPRNMVQAIDAAVWNAIASDGRMKELLRGQRAALAEAVEIIESLPPFINPDDKSVRYPGDVLMLEICKKARAFIAARQKEM